MLWSNLSYITVLQFGCFAQEGQMTLLAKSKKELSAAGLFKYV